MKCRRAHVNTVPGSNRHRCRRIGNQLSARYLQTGRSRWSPAFEKFENRPASGRDAADVVGDAELIAAGIVSPPLAIENAGDSEMAGAIARVPPANASKE